MVAWGLGVGSRFGPYVRDVVFKGSERLTLDTSNSDSIWGWEVVPREHSCIIARRKP